MSISYYRSRLLKLYIKINFNNLTSAIKRERGGSIQGTTEGREFKKGKTPHKQSTPSSVPTKTQVG